MTSRLFFRALIVTAALAVLIGVPRASLWNSAPRPILGPARVFAAGVVEGLNAMRAVDVPTSGNIRQKIVVILNTAVSYLALAGVIAVIVAGIMLIVGFGSENVTQRAKKIIIYTMIGLAIVFFTRVIVGFFTQEITQ